MWTANTYTRRLARRAPRPTALQTAQPTRYAEVPERRHVAASRCPQSTKTQTSLRPRHTRSDYTDSRPCPGLAPRAPAVTGRDALRRGAAITTITNDNAPFSWKREKETIGCLDKTHDPIHVLHIFIRPGRECAMTYITPSPCALTASSLLYPKPPPHHLVLRGLHLSHSPWASRLSQLSHEDGVSGRSQDEARRAGRALVVHILPTHILQTC